MKKKVIYTNLIQWLPYKTYARVSINALFLFENHRDYFENQTEILEQIFGEEIKD